MDIRSIRYVSAGGAKFRGLFLDDCTNFLFGIYLRRKSDLADEGMKLIKEIKNNYQVIIKRIRCDSGGENKLLEKNVIENRMNILFLNIQLQILHSKMDV